MIQAQVSQAELLYEAQQRKVRQFRTNVVLSWLALLGFLIFLFNGPIEIDSEFIRKNTLFIAGGLGENFKTGFERIIRLDQFQVSRAAVKQAGKERLEVRVDDIKRAEEALAGFLVELADAFAEFFNGLNEVIAFRLHRGHLVGDFLRFDFGAEVDRTHVVALADEALQLYL